MKKLLLIIFCVFICNSNLALAEGDLWDNYGDTNTYGQKSVSDKDFNTMIENLKNKGKKKKKPDKDIPKGESFQQSNETQFLNQAPKDLPILLIPLNLIVNEKTTVPTGHYQVIGEKKDGKTVLKLYQSRSLIAELPAVETEEDFGQKTISFVSLKQYSTRHVQIIFGSLDFNAYSIVNIQDMNENEE